MAGGHGQDGQGQEIGGDGTTTTGDGPKSTPDIFQIRKFVPQPQPNHNSNSGKKHVVVVFLSTLLVASNHQCWKESFF